MLGGNTQTALHPGWHYPFHRSWVLPEMDRPALGTEVQHPTIIGNDVFLGPNVVFTDDPHPMGCAHYKECKGGARVEDLVKIGANTTLLPGVKLGKNCLIGAGSVVVTDVPQDAVVVGNPARVVKNINELECWPGFYSKPYVWAPYNLKIEKK